MSIEQLINRTWAVAQSGELKDIAPLMTNQAALPLEDFYRHMLKSPVLKLVIERGIAFTDEEFIIYDAEPESGGTDCLVTNRKLIRLASNPKGTDIDVRTALLTGFDGITPDARDPKRISLHNKKGHTLELTLSRPLSRAAIEFAFEQRNRTWDALGAVDVADASELEELRPAINEAAEAADEAVKPTIRESAERKEETWGDVFASMVPMFVGFLAFAFFLLVSGAPLFEGGPAVIVWLSQDNMAFLIGAVVVGFLTASFMPGSKS